MMAASLPVIKVLAAVFVFSMAGSGAQKAEPCDESAPDGECMATAPGQSAIQRAKMVQAHVVGEDDGQRNDQQATGGTADKATEQWSWPWEKKTTTTTTTTPPPTHFIEFVPGTKTPVPRKEVNGFVREVVFRYPLTDGVMSLSADGKKVHIQFEKMMEANYSRDTPVNGRSDFGVQKAMAFKSNPGSIVSDRVELMFLEKTHALYSPVEDYPSWTKQAAQEDQAGRWTATEKLSKRRRVRSARDLAVNMFTMGGVAGQMVGNGFGDVAAKDAVREFVDSSGGDVSEKEWENIDKVSTRIASRAAKAAKTPIRSSPACMHFEKSDAIAYGGDGTDITLGKKLVTYRGRLLFSPNEEYDMLLGYSVFYHNKAANSIDLYVAGSHMLTFQKASMTGWEAALWVGNADGASWQRSAESRQPSPKQSRMARAAYKAADKVPLDYEFLYKDRTDAGCPDSALAQMEADSDAILHTMSMKDMSTIKHVTNILKCGVEYLRPDDAGHNAGYNFLEALGFFHFAMEVPPKTVATSMGRHIDWNTVNGVEAHKP